MTQRTLAGLAACLMVSGCVTAAKHAQRLGSTQDRNVTIGLVQQQVTAGASQTHVAETIGSPNIVTRDRNGREAWVYDKIATEASFSQGNGRVAAEVTGSGSLKDAGVASGMGSGFESGTISGFFGGAYAEQAGAVNLTQRTLTVVIRFDGNHTVETVSWHTTKF